MHASTLSHTPGSTPGCTIFREQDVSTSPADRTFVHAHMAVGLVQGRHRARRDARRVSPLYRDAREDVRVERWAPGATVMSDRADKSGVLEGGRGAETTCARVPGCVCRTPSGFSAAGDGFARGSRRHARVR